MKPGYRAGLTSRARTYGHAPHKHLLTKTRHLFNTSFPLVLYRERRILRTYTGMAAARKSTFSNPYERTDGAKEAVLGRKKGSSTSRKRLFGGAEAEKALRRCGRGSSAKRNIITGRAGKRYYTGCKRIMQYPEKYVPKHGKPHIRKPEEFQAVPATCFLTFQDVFSSSEQLPDGASHTVTGWRYKMGQKPLCLL